MQLNILRFTGNSDVESRETLGVWGSAIVDGIHPCELVVTAIKYHQGITAIALLVANYYIYLTKCTSHLN